MATQKPICRVSDPAEWKPENCGPESIVWFTPECVCQHDRDVPVYGEMASPSGEMVEVVRLLPPVHLPCGVTPEQFELFIGGHLIPALEVDAANDRNVTWALQFLAGLLSTASGGAGPGTRVLGPVPICKVDAHTLGWAAEFRPSLDDMGILSMEYEDLFNEVVQVFHYILNSEEPLLRESDRSWRFFGQVLLTLLAAPFVPACFARDPGDVAVQTAYVQPWNNTPTRSTPPHTAIVAFLNRLRETPWSSYLDSVQDLLPTYLARTGLGELVRPVFLQGFRLLLEEIDPKTSGLSDLALTRLARLGETLLGGLPLAHDFTPASLDFSAYARHFPENSPQWRAFQWDIVPDGGSVLWTLMTDGYWENHIPDTAAVYTPAERQAGFSQGSVQDGPGPEAAGVPASRVLQTTPDGYVVSFALRVGNGWTVVAPRDVPEGDLSEMVGIVTEHGMAPGMGGGADPGPRSKARKSLRRVPRITASLKQESIPVGDGTTKPVVTGQQGLELVLSKGKSTAKVKISPLQFFRLLIVWCASQPPNRGIAYPEKARASRPVVCVSATGFEDVPGSAEFFPENPKRTQFFTRPVEKILEAFPDLRDETERYFPETTRRCDPEDRRVKYNVRKLKSVSVEIDDPDGQLREVVYKAQDGTGHRTIPKEAVAAVLDWCAEVSQRGT